MISSYYSSASWRSAMLGSFSELRESLDRESMKLSSGMRSTNYAGLGSDVATSIKLHNRLDQIGSFADLISGAQTEINFTAQALTSLNTLADSVNAGPLSLAGGSDKVARVTAKSGLQTQFSTLISYLRTQGPSGYIFGGAVSATPPVEDSDHLLNGQNGQAGLSQLFDERFQADAGADNLGRLIVSTSGNQVSVAEEAAGLPFGLKLASIESGLTNVSVTQPTGTPKSESLTFNGQPTIGDVVTLNFTLPDGSTSSISLRASAVAGTGQFAVGATVADTMANFQTALKTSISSMVASDLYSASAVYTTKNFFASDATHPPDRVVGPPFTSATQIQAGTAANTVIWYSGKSDNQDPRADRSVKIGEDVSIHFGVRANEGGIQAMLAGVAAAALVSQKFSGDETTASNQMIAIRQRASKTVSSGKTEVQAMTASIAASQTFAKQIADQNASMKSLLQTRLASIEGVNAEEAATMISSLTTQLQASYQVTSKLLNLSLSSYL